MSFSGQAVDAWFVATAQLRFVRVVEPDDKPAGVFADVEDVGPWSNRFGAMLRTAGKSLRRCFAQTMPFEIQPAH